VYIFKRKEEETDEEPTSNDVGLNCINQTPSLTCLLLDISSQPAEKDDWRKSVTFHTFTKIEDKNCVVIVDSESCINAISSRLCEHLGLGCTPPPPIQSIMDWLHGTRGQTMMSCPSQFQSLQRQYLVWCDSPWMWVKSYYVHHDCSIKMSQFTVNPTCVNLSMRVSRSSYYSWEPRLDSPSRYSLWLYCQLHLSHLLVLLFPPYHPLLIHTMSANRFLPHHPVIAHSSLHLHLHHTNTCTNYIKRSVMKINWAMWNLLMYTWSQLPSNTNKKKKLRFTRNKIKREIRVGERTR